MAEGNVEYLEQELEARMERVAKAYQDACMRLAPDYGMHMVPWDEVPKKHRDLMIAGMRDMVTTLLLEDGVLRAAAHRPYDAPWPAVEPPPLGTPPVIAVAVQFSGRDAEDLRRLSARHHLPFTGVVRAAVGGMAGRLPDDTGTIPD